jgi:hypothetical protein
VAIDMRIRLKRWNRMANWRTWPTMFYWRRVRNWQSAAEEWVKRCGSKFESVRSPRRRTRVQRPAERRYHLAWQKAERRRCCARATAMLTGQCPYLGDEAAAPRQARSAARLRCTCSAPNWRCAATESH